MKVFLPLELEITLSLTFSMTFMSMKILAELNALVLSICALVNNEPSKSVSVAIVDFSIFRGYTQAFSEPQRMASSTLYHSQ